MAPMKRPLNVRQERFCEFIAAGESQTGAYIKAGFRVSKADARKHAARLMTKDDIKARIAELRKPQTRRVLMTRDEKREKLRQIVESESIGIMAKLRALELDAKLAGDFAPEQHVVETSNKTLESIQERARRITSLMSIAPPDLVINRE